MKRCFALVDLHKRPGLRAVSIKLDNHGSYHNGALEMGPIRLKMSGCGSLLENPGVLNAGIGS